MFCQNLVKVGRKSRKCRLQCDLLFHFIFSSSSVCSYKHLAPTQPTDETNENRCKHKWQKRHRHCITYHECSDCCCVTRNEYMPVEAIDSRTHHRSYGGFFYDIVQPLRSTLNLYFSFLFCFFFSCHFKTFSRVHVYFYRVLTTTTPMTTMRTKDT